MESACTVYIVHTGPGVRLVSASQSSYQHACYPRALAGAAQRRVPSPKRNEEGATGFRSRQTLQLGALHGGWEGEVQ